MGGREWVGEAGRAEGAGYDGAVAGVAPLCLPPARLYAPLPLAASAAAAALAATQAPTHFASDQLLFTPAEDQLLALGIQRCAALCVCAAWGGVVGRDRMGVVGQ